MRVISTFLIIALCVTQIIPVGMVEAYAFNNSIETAAFTPRGQILPEELGKLRQVFLPNKKYQTIYQRNGFNSVIQEISSDKQPFVFVLEDAHSSLEAQRNIADLIQFIYQTWGVKLIALEGAEGRVVLDSIQDKLLTQERREVLDFYLEEALLSGPEYEVFRSPRDYVVYGAEMMKLYKADRKIYLEVLEQQPKAQKKLSRFEKELNKKKKEIYSPELLSFDKREQEFLDNQGRYLNSFIPYMIKVAAKKGLRPKAKSSLGLMSRVLANADELSMASLEQELELFKKENPFYKNEVEIIQKRFLPRGLDFDFEITGPPPELPTLFLYRYKAILTYLNVAAMRYELDTPEVFGEIDEFRKRTKKVLIKTPEERELNQDSSALRVLKRIIGLTALREDLALENVERLAERLKEKKLYKRALYFYELAKKRDEVLISKTLEAIEESKVKPKAAILVVGGFHTEGIRTILEQTKIGYMIVAPKFESDLSNEKLYRMRLSGDLALLNSQISPEKNIGKKKFVQGINGVVEAHENDKSISGAYQKTIPSKDEAEQLDSEYAAAALGTESLLNHPELDEEIREMISANSLRGTEGQSRLEVESAQSLGSAGIMEAKHVFELLGIADARATTGESAPKLSSDGKWIAVFSSGNKAYKLVNTDTPYFETVGYFSNIEFAKDSKSAIIRFRDGTYKVISLELGRAGEDLGFLFSEDVGQVYFSPGNRWIVAKNKDDTYQVFDSKTTHSVEGYLGTPLYGVRFSPNDNWVAGFYRGFDSSADRTQSFAQLFNKRLEPILGSDITDVKASPGWRYGIAKHINGALKLIDFETGEVIDDFLPNNPFSYYFSPDGVVLQVIGADQKKSFYNLQTQIQLSFPDVEDVNEVSGLENGFLVVERKDGSFEIPNLISEEDRRIVFEKEATAFYMPKATDLLAVSYRDGSKKIFETVTDSGVVDLEEKFGKNIVGFFPAPTGDLGVVFYGDGQAAAFDLVTKERTDLPIRDNLKSVRFSEDHRWIVLVYEGEERLVDRRDNSEVEIPDEMRQRGIHFMADGQWVVSAVLDEFIDMYQPSSGIDVRNLIGPGSGERPIFSAGGGLLYFRFKNGDQKILNLSAIFHNSILQEASRRWGESAYYGFELFSWLISSGIVQTERDMRDMFNFLLPEIERLDQATTDYNRQKILKILQPDGIFEYIRQNNGDFRDNFSFYVDLVDSSKRLALRVIEGLVDSVQRGQVPVRLTTGNKTNIKRFIDRTNDFNPILYQFYVEKGPRALQEVLAWGDRILNDSITLEEIAAAEDRIREMGYDGPEIAYAVLQKVMPTAGHSFVGKQEARRQWNVFRKAGDGVRAHVPEVLRELGRFGREEFIKTVWKLREGEQLAREGAIEKVVSNLQFQDIESGEVERSEAVEIDRKRFIEAFKNYLTNPALGDSEALKAFLIYASHNDNIRRHMQKANLSSYGGIVLLEQLFLDSNLLPKLFKKALEDGDVSSELLMAEGTKKIHEKTREGRGFKSYVFKIWNNLNLSVEDKEEIFARVLDKYDRDDLRLRVPELFSENLELQNSLLKTIEDMDSNFLQSREMVREDFFAETLRLIRQEKDKFDQVELPNPISLAFRVVKSPAYGMYGSCAGLCKTDDLDLWKDPNFYLLQMMDESIGGAVGFVQLFQTERDGKRYLMASGVEPTERFLSSISAHEIYPAIERALIEVARTGGFDYLVMPTNPDILSNKGAVRKVIGTQGYPQRFFSKPIQWRYTAELYPVWQAYIAWDREADASSLGSVRDELTRDELQAQKYAVALHRLIFGGEIAGVKNEGLIMSRFKLKHGDDQNAVLSAILERVRLHGNNIKVDTRVRNRTQLFLDELKANKPERYERYRDVLDGGEIFNITGQPNEDLKRKAEFLKREMLRFDRTKFRDAYDSRDRKRLHELSAQMRALLTLYNKIQIERALRFAEIPPASWNTPVISNLLLSARNYTKRHELEVLMEQIRNQADELIEEFERRFAGYADLDVDLLGKDAIQSILDVLNAKGWGIRYEDGKYIVPQRRWVEVKQGDYVYSKAESKNVQYKDLSSALRSQIHTIESEAEDIFHIQLQVAELEKVLLLIRGYKYREIKEGTLNQVFSILTNIREWLENGKVVQKQESVNHVNAAIEALEVAIAAPSDTPESLKLRNDALSKMQVNTRQIVAKLGKDRKSRIAEIKRIQSRVQSRLNAIKPLVDRPESKVVFLTSEILYEVGKFDEEYAEDVVLDVRLENHKELLDRLDRASKTAYQLANGYFKDVTRKASGFKRAKPLINQVANSLYHLKKVLEGGGLASDSQTDLKQVARDLVLIQANMMLADESDAAFTKKSQSIVQHTAPRMSLIMQRKEDMKRRLERRGGAVAGVRKKIALSRQFKISKENPLTEEGAAKLVELIKTYPGRTEIQIDKTKKTSQTGEENLKKYLLESFLVGNGFTITLEPSNEPQAEKLLADRMSQISDFLEKQNNFASFVADASLGEETDVFGGGLYDPNHELVASGRIVNVSSFQDIEGRDLVEYAKYLRETQGVNRIIFDLDMTLFRAKGYLSSSKWFEKVMDEFGFAQALDWWARYSHEERQIENGFFYRLTEPNIPEMIQSLREADFEVVALTARRLKDDSVRTGKILEQLGIQLDEVLYAGGSGAKSRTLVEYENRAGKTASLVVEDSFGNLENLLSDFDHLSGLYYKNPEAFEEDSWDYGLYLEKARQAKERGDYAHALEYYFNVAVRIWELEDFDFDRPAAYQALRDLEIEVLELQDKNLAGVDKLLKAIQVSKTGEAYFFHDDVGRGLREGDSEGVSLGEEVSVIRVPAKVLPQKPTVANFSKNVFYGNKPVYLLVPASILKFLDIESIENVLSNPSNEIDILWEASDPKGAVDRLTYLGSLGLERYISQGNFSANISNKELSARGGLVAQAEHVAASLQDKNVPVEQIAFLKPEALTEKVKGLLSLRASKNQPLSIYWLLYLVQMQGNLTGGFLSGFQLEFDEKTGDFVVRIDEELARLFVQEMTRQAIAKAA